jgi:hypothetical protein
MELQTFWNLVLQVSCTVEWVIGHRYMVITAKGHLENVNPINVLEYPMGFHKPWSQLLPVRRRQVTQISLQDKNIMDNF